ncbi:uncharacterized protein LOC128072081 isoform X3 [Tympanuchus pallidicinctus]|uniref:uncharacterized protein LOC128072081 isoform X3 n=2 Tax=Tympanuchus pallidicinctus TaxID=109042 RepID=UPI0022873B35|nr:uncharacterized protein LOC128072081 isoform X3 [Tympanuchus pallidicinctus]
MGCQALCHGVSLPSARSVPWGVMVCYRPSRGSQCHGVPCSARSVPWGARLCAVGSLCQVPGLCHGASWCAIGHPEDPSAMGCRAVPDLCHGVPGFVPWGPFAKCQICAMGCQALCHGVPLPSARSVPWGARLCAVGSLCQVPGLCHGVSLLFVPGLCPGTPWCARSVPRVAMRCHILVTATCSSPCSALHPAAPHSSLTRVINSSSISVCNEPGPQGWGSVGEQPRQPPARRTASSSQHCGALHCLPGALCFAAGMFLQLWGRAPAAGDAAGVTGSCSCCCSTPGFTPGTWNCAPAAGAAPGAELLLLGCSWSRGAVLLLLCSWDCSWSHAPAAAPLGAFLTLRSSCWRCCWGHGAVLLLPYCWGCSWSCASAAGDALGVVELCSCRSALGNAPGCEELCSSC